MRILPTKEELISFEDDISNCFKNKQIRAPIHLSYNNENQLISIFEEIKDNDWVLCSWRSHYHCLLKGVPKELVKKEILEGRSISLCFKDHKVLSSAIVGGNISIALGIALDIKRKQQKDKVYCFVGDMTSLTGIFNEAVEYAFNFKLPIIFVIENNELSVCTNTLKTWGYVKHPREADDFWTKHRNYIQKHYNVWYYKYDLHSKYPHAGIGGTRIQF